MIIFKKNDVLYVLDRKDMIKIVMFEYQLIIIRC